jgi:hypothetical protein
MQVFRRLTVEPAGSDKAAQPCLRGAKGEFGALVARYCLETVVGVIGDSQFRCAGQPL